MKPIPLSRGGLVVQIPAALALVSSLSAGTVTWDNSNGTALWSTAANWDTNVEPVAGDDLIFPTGLAGTIVLSSGELAKSLQFDANYTLNNGAVTLASGGGISVGSGVTATLGSMLTVSTAPSKIGDGTLVLSGANSSSNPVGISIAAGKVRAGGNNGLGGTAAITTVNSGTALEIANNITVNVPVTLKHGGTVTGLGTSTSNGKITVDAAAATLVTLGTDQAADVFTIGNGANDLSGGSTDATIQLGGAGTVRLGFASDYDGSWTLPSGRLDLGAATALGDQPGESVILSGGALAGRMSAATSFITSPGNNLVMTASSSLISDRNSISAGVAYTFGGLSMGAHTLTVAPGANATSGTAGITLGNVTLSGDPMFAVNDLGVTNGKLTTGSLVGSAVARAITKTGAGDLAVTGGATDLPVGSSFAASGGGTIEMLFSSLGTDATVNVSAVQNPFGAASIAITDGGLRLLADGSGTTAAQTYALPTSLTLGGTVTLDSDRRSGANTNKTFELPALTLAPNTVLSMAGGNTHGVRLTGALALQGDATLKGIDVASKNGLLTLNAGISGAAGDELTIAGGTSPLNLTLNAASTYGGGTLMTGSNVTLNAANAFGTGATTVNGGTLTVAVAGALAGTATINGGTLRVNGADLLASNPVLLSGGTLDLRNNTGANISTGSLTVSGTSTLNVANNGSGTLQVMTLPTINVSGPTTLTLSSANSFIPNLSSIVLAGDLTVNNAVTARIQTISEDASPRAFLKTGAGVLEFKAASTHSGGTEVLAGTVLIEHAGALGSGSLVLGSTSGTATAIAQVASGLTISNDLVARLGSSGALTLDAPSGGVTWNGDADLQRTLTLDNGSATVAATMGGQITGVGDMAKVSAGEFVLANPANSFGSGAAGSVTVSDGVLSIAADGALGNPANGVTLSGNDGVLKIDGTFGTSRTLTMAASGTATGVSVSGAHEFTVNAALAGTGLMLKSGTGVMTFAPGVDSSARGTASSGVTAGTLRVQGITNLSNAGPVTLNGGTGTIEFLADPNTNFAHPVIADGTGTLHVGRAIGGSGSSGRHTLGALGMDSGNLTVTGANGYGLTLGAATVSANNFITNNAPGALVLASLTGNPGSGSVTMTMGGSGDIEISGALAEGAGTGNYGITKTGGGTLRLGSSVAEFGRLTNVQDGTLDLNNLSYPVSALTLGGATSALGARLNTGAAGAIELGGTLTYSAAFTPPGAVITGNLGLGAASRSFAIGESGPAAIDLTIDGVIGGSAGAEIVKSGAGTLRLSGAGNTQPGAIVVTAGVLELAKSSGDGVGTGGLNLSGGRVVLTVGEQVNNGAAVALDSSSDVFFELNGFTETVGSLSLSQSDAGDYTAVKTGSGGTLVLNGNLTLNNNTDNSIADGREVVITGSGSEFVPANDGTLDLGGAVRTIHVTTTTVGANEPLANATIETQIVNGGIVKTGPRTLLLTHPNNLFAGGLQIAAGQVRPSTPGSLGTGTVSFTNAAGVAAGLDLSALTGTLPNDFSLTGSGEITLTHSAPAPDALVLSGDIDISQDLVFDVVNGSVREGDSAVLDVTGTIDDAAGTFGVIKRGHGTLKLAAGNTFGGATTVEAGILAIGADSALGDSTAAVVIDGGCLKTSAPVTLARNVTMGSAGGTLRAASHFHTLELPGNLAWGGGTTAFDGNGRIVLSGTTSGTGDVLLGDPTAFAPGTTDFNSWSTKLALQGSASLPAGNLSMVNDSILELGNGDFTRPLGTGSGEVQLPGTTGGGWAAVGADRVVNLGGASATLQWASTSPPFLDSVTSGSGGETGTLFLGSATATHTVEFQNPLNLDHPEPFFQTCQVACWNGAAAVDARISGDLTFADPERWVQVSVGGDGTLEISGDILGRTEIEEDGDGTTILSGDNDLFDGIVIFNGTIRLATNDSLGSPGRIELFPGGSAHLDASALTVPVTLGQPGAMLVDALLTGDVLVNGLLEGFGEITGDVTVPAESSVFPHFDGTLHVGGDFNLESGGGLEFDLEGPVPEVNHNRLRVTGAVNLAGYVDLDSFGGLAVNDSVVLLLNDGTDPISGTFSGLPEGASVPIGGDLALRVTYLANGDGGAIGNDFGVTLVEDNLNADLAVTASGPVAVALNAPFTLTYTVENHGPFGSSGSVIDIAIPANVTLTDSTPSGTLNGGTLSIPVPPILNGGNTAVTVNLTSPATEAPLSVTATVTGIEEDVVPGNNADSTITAALVGGRPRVSVFTADLQQMFVGLDTMNGVKYALQNSQNLAGWTDVVTFTGDGGLRQFVVPVAGPKGFYRFAIQP